MREEYILHKITKFATENFKFFEKDHFFSHFNYSHLV